MRGDEDGKDKFLHPDSCLRHRDLLLIVSLKKSEDKPNQRGRETSVGKTFPAPNGPREKSVAIPIIGGEGF